MTNKFAMNILEQRECCRECVVENCTCAECDEAFDMAIKALKQEPYDFARWVASEIFDDMWEYNKDAFAEIACRKLAKLGIVIAKGDEWELVEERSDKECMTKI